MPIKHKFLTKNGMILSKKKLKQTEIKMIKKDLTVKPKLHPDFMTDEVESNELFEESKDAICVPRFYGTQKFGKPVAEIPLDNCKTEMKFTKKLRPMQVPIAESCLKDIKEKGGGIISLPCGSGKCLAKGTPVMMYDGSIKNVEDIIVGDKLMGDDSKPRNVLSLARGREEMYDVIPTKGPKYTVNKSHILSLKYNTISSYKISGIGYDKKLKKGDIVDISIEDYLKLPKSYHGRGSPLRGFRVPINFKPQKVELDPYILGLWLGDGNRRKPQITNIDKEVLNYMNDFAKKNNLNINPLKEDKITYRFTKKRNEDNFLITQLKKLNLFKNKHVPQIYKCNSREVRLQVLAGLLDSDGHLAQNCFDICQKRENLIDDIIFIARSLGLAAYKTESWKTCTNSKNGPIKCRCFRTCIHGDTHIIPTKIKRKQAGKRKQIKDVTVYGIKVVPVGVDDYYGFEIDGNRRFLLGDFSVTHNTVLALHLACQLGLKTLVVVHKTFLQNQWYDRIKQFTNARVGTIRQKKVDVKNKDIVVGMLQSISMIDYDQTIFEDFGCVIFDECHHCASRVFSNALYKLGSKYMIGLSATPFRADGLTKILYWYMGDIIYRLTRKTDNTAYVKFINYEAKNRFFVEKKQWVKGKIRPAVIKMITNICKADPRNQFLIDIIDHLKGLYERKILILSGRLDHLRILKEGVDALIKEQEEEGLIDKNEFTTSYYIGKMKAGQLEVASEADIIFATYAMAEEGLDIDKLNTLVLATPKLNVEQSVGRIMRKQIKEGDTPPLIVDVVDQLSSFERWGETRRKFYTKHKYKVEFYQAFNDHFVGMKEYMYLKKMITKRQFKDKNLDVRKEYIMSQFGEDHYEMEEETGFEDDPIEKYTINPTLKSVFKISATIYKEDDEIPNDDNLIMQGRLKMK